MKRYIVFLKQVPLSTHVAIDPKTNTLKRASAMTQTNPDDLYALQAALDLKKQTEAEVVAVSMGPASAVEVLHEALQRGADRAVLLSSPVFAGSDTWCTSRVLATAVRKLASFDLLFFGRMAIDGDTAQVGPEVAGQLNIPQVTQLLGIERVEASHIYVNKQADMMRQTLEIQLPCALMVGKEYGNLANPTLRGWRWAEAQTIVRWDEHDLDLTRQEVGLDASPTQVVRTEVPRQEKVIQWLADGEQFLAQIQALTLKANER